LNFLRNNQTKLRVDKYKSIRDATHSDQSNPQEIGKQTILPSTFTGSPRHMEQLFQEAMSCMRVHGKPDLFVTFTANPKWPEIICELDKGQEPNDRPDLITRVFNKIATNLMPGQLFNIHSYDKLMDDSSQAKYPTEFFKIL
jgi:hypothetical protein